VNTEGCCSTVICLLAKNSLTDSFLIQAPTFSRWHTKTHSDNNRCHSERGCHRSTTQLWNADMPTSLNHTEVSVHCCHGKHMVASARNFIVRHHIHTWKWAIRLMSNVSFCNS
jgi:hypothetical protein